MADPKQAEQVQRFLAGLQAERQSKLGETSGVGDILGLLGLRQAPLLTAASGIDRLTGLDQSPYEEGMAFPVFGVGKTGRLAAAHRRLKGKKSIEKPLLNPESKKAPRRAQEIEKRMREWLPMTSAGDVSEREKLLDEFIKTRPKGWGKVPVEKDKLIDHTPMKLRQSLYQTLKEMGYGGIQTGNLVGNRRNFSRGPGPGTSGTMQPHTARTWEEILQFEQKGNVPAGWEKAFQALQEIEAARPPKPKTKTVGGR